MMAEKTTATSSSVALLTIFLIDCFSCCTALNLVAGHMPTPSELCDLMIQPRGYPCSEYTGGDAWFLNSVEESLGFLLADNDFDVWIGNVRGSRWSRKHVTLSEHDKAFWNWSWQDLAQYDLAAMLSYVHAETNSKVLYVGHSQGTIMALAAFTMPDIVKLVDAAALLCPISYLNHISSSFVLRAVGLHLDQMLLSLGIHELNFRSNLGVEILNALCDGHLDCGSLLSAITGNNCCFNASRVEYYLQYEPHASSTKTCTIFFRVCFFIHYDWYHFSFHYQ
ncbi:hypothetical protein HPP92_008253 [Vanilla planifolia]|uniref:AB hydrolase-1 domain-containing protein n=1 Tax=Vanilla planifolia TaxID=51239 RepID=A0A835R4D8_VANPL|nr:hypothetical protein HPP92_008253 [Vanilla planifolia]